MAKKEKCPDCPHDFNTEHDQWAGCRHQHRGSSGQLVICPCTRLNRPANHPVEVNP